jgi:peptide-methionine (S)-S-oxide reductase
VTELAPLDVFYPRRTITRITLRNNPMQPYCQVVIAPKVAKFRKQYFAQLRRGAVQSFAQEVR